MFVAETRQWGGVYLRLVAKRQDKRDKHPVGKIRIIQEPNKAALWNIRHFEEKKNGDYASYLKYSVCLFV